MRSAWGEYSPGAGVWLCHYYLFTDTYNLHYIDCASSKCSNGWYVWEWHFSL